MADWDDTVKAREEGEYVGFVGRNETVEAHRANSASGQPIEDVRRDAVAATEDSGGEVVDPVPQPPASNPSPAPKETQEPGVSGPEDNGDGFNQQQTNQ